MKRALRAPLNIHVDVPILQALMEEAEQSNMNMPTFVRKLFADHVAARASAATGPAAEENDFALIDELRAAGCITDDDE